jgi:4-carboxymuconolactone decarboxylase
MSEGVDINKPSLTIEQQKTKGGVAMKVKFILIVSFMIGLPLFTAFAEDRMPAISNDKMTEAQRNAVAELTSGPRGAISGPFWPLLRSPEFMSRLQKTGEYLRYHSVLGPKLNEFVILIVARQRAQQYEWFAHYPYAIKAGLKPDIAQAIAEGRRPAGMAGDEEIVYDFCDELFRTQGVSDATYERAVKKFGEQGVIDMLGVNGYYTMVAMILNVARTPLPDNKPTPLALFPH